ncbi:MAG: adenylate/guanylate cyclase domain-containing protein [Saprospirales bacterium]|nr:adenylate/guanylate cyclase domain-containing protein [Saprospirales bacterium]
MGFPLSAQSSNLENREAGMATLSGNALIQEALSLSDGYYSARQLGKAAEMAQLAYEEASKGNDKAAMAMALNRGAKAALANPQIRPAERLRTIRKLEESNTLTTNDDLRLENFKILRQIYAHLGKNADVRATEREIAKLVAEKNRSLENELEVASKEQVKMEALQKSLVQTIDKRGEAIDSMTESQAKAELLLAQQKSILDSMAFLSMIDSLKLAQQSMELNEKEAILRERDAQRNFLLALSALGLVVLGGLFLRFLGVKRHNKQIAEEKKRSDDLLLNILPQKVADELKLNGKAKAQFFESASVLFVDFAGFSQFAANLPPDELVETLDFCFQEFDRIIVRNGLEKIKTIGDAYMAAGGLPSPDPANPGMVVNAALEIKDFLDSWKKSREAEGKPFLRARIGIHTGPLVAGVVGEKNSPMISGAIPSMSLPEWNRAASRARSISPPPPTNPLKANSSAKNAARSPPRTWGIWTCIL